MKVIRKIYNQRGVCFRVLREDARKLVATGRWYKKSPVIQKKEYDAFDLLPRIDRLATNMGPFILNDNRKNTLPVLRNILSTVIVYDKASDAAQECMAADLPELIKTGRYKENI